MEQKIKYPILIVNGIAVLFAYYFNLNNPLVMLWGWSIWGMIIYEYIQFIYAIEKRKYIGLNKFILIINGISQLLFNLTYSYLIVNNIRNIYSIYFLCLIQVLKFITSFVYKEGIEKRYREYKKLSAEEVAEQVSEKIKQYLLFNKEYKLEGNSKLLLTSATSIIYLFSTILISNLLILIVDNKSFEIFIFLVFSIILLLLNYSVYCLKDKDYKKWIICTLGCILSFSIFNEILDVNVGQMFTKIFFTTYFLTPHLLYVRQIINKYQLLE